MSYHYLTQFGPEIAGYWRTHFPEEMQPFDRRGNLDRLADRAADRAIALVVEARLKHGLPFQKAYDLAALHWQTPPSGSGKQG